LVASPSQSPKPSAQLSPHRPAAHTARAFTAPGHAAPHALQWFTSVVALTHVPPQRISPVSQPELHAAPVGPRLQRGVPPLQALPQRPQLAVPVRFASQPLVASPSQSANPSLQLDAQRPAAQLAVEFAGVGQARPHAPQCVALVCVGASQPLVASPSQSAKSALQANPQRPAAQAALALAGAGHTFPHAPQWVALVCVAASQPLVASPSQSAKPALQVNPQRPIAQRAAAFAGAAQVAPHAPQCARLDVTSVSQPSAASPSQSP
jgi:hypothetical protein